MSVSNSPVRLSDIQYPMLVEGVSYWLERWKSLGHLPGRRHLDPLDIPRILPYVELSDVIDGGIDFRFRLIGTHLVGVDGVDPTGEFISSFFKIDSYRDHQLMMYRHVVETRWPLYSRNTIPLVDHNVCRRTERIYCPLASDGQNVDMIINFQVCEGVQRGEVSMEMVYDPRMGDGVVAPLEKPPL